MVGNKRLDWIDICKAIAIYLMVLGHTGVSERLNIFIHAFHMPVFFILSGYCFNDEKNRNFISFAKKRLLSLILPYIIFGIGLFLFWDISLLILNRKDEVRSIYNLATSLLWHNADASAFGVIQWFLTCLFFTELICSVIIYCFKNRLKVMIGILICFSISAYVYPLIFDFRLPLAIDCALMAVSFYGLGWLMRKIDIDSAINKIKENKLKFLFATLFVFVFFLPLVFLNGHVNMRTITYGNYFLFIINAITYSFILLLISIIIDISSAKLKKIITIVGQNTLVVLLLNSTFIRIYQVVFSKLISGLSDSYIYAINFFVALLITIACVIASKTINNFFPWMIGKTA